METILAIALGVTLKIRKYGMRKLVKSEKFGYQIYRKEKPGVRNENPD